MIVQMLTYPAQAHVLIGSRATEPAPRTITAPETSEQAQQLRASGWVARAGWLSRTSSGLVWHVRFESPGELDRVTSG